MKFKLGVLLLTLVLACGIVYANEEDLLVHYTFDEFEENVVVDASPNEINGELNGEFNLVEGVIGQALYFDGETFVGMPEISLEEYPDLTLSFWVNPEELGSWVVMFRMLRELDDFYFMFLNDQVALFWAPAGYSPTFEIPVGEWSNLAVIFTDDTIIFYLNGEEVAAYSTPKQIGDMGQLESISIGGGDHNPYMKGTMDEFRIYKRALAPEEIQAVYQEVVQ